MKNLQVILIMMLIVMAGLAAGKFLARILKENAGLNFTV